MTLVLQSPPCGGSSFGHIAIQFHMCFAVVQTTRLSWLISSSFYFFLSRISFQERVFFYTWWYTGKYDTCTSCYHPFSPLAFILQRHAAAQPKVKTTKTPPNAFPSAIRLGQQCLGLAVYEKKYALSLSFVTSKSPLWGISGKVSGSQTGMVLGLTFAALGGASFSWKCETLVYMAA